MKRLGNSAGTVVPKEMIEALRLKQNQTRVLSIMKTENPLKEFFGFGKHNKITEQESKETRKLFDSKLK